MISNGGALLMLKYKKKASKIGKIFQVLQKFVYFYISFLCKVVLDPHHVIFSSGFI